MKNNCLNTTVDTGYIFGLEELSYHTKCILSKIVIDFMKEDGVLPGWIYLEDEIFGVWSENIIFRAIDELADADIMFIAPPEELVNDEGELIIADGVDEDDFLYENSILIFNHEFIEDACPLAGVCPCCNPDKKAFDIIYN